MSDRKYFKYIRSTEKDKNGKTIYSGQRVSVHGRINKREIVEVFFEPNHGFRIQGNNFADAYDIDIETDISIFNKITGAIKFAIFSITGYSKKPKEGLQILECAICGKTPVVTKRWRKQYYIRCEDLECYMSCCWFGDTKKDAIRLWNVNVEKMLCRKKELHECLES